MTVPVPVPVTRCPDCRLYDMWNDRCQHPDTLDDLCGAAKPLPTWCKLRLGPAVLVLVEGDPARFEEPLI